MKIDYKEDWPKSHFRTLLSCYNRSAFFEYYRDELERIFQARSPWLVDWNLACLEWLISVLNLDIMVGKTGSFQFEYPSSEYLDFRGLLDPANRILPNVSAVPYTQVFAERAGFVPGLSILDLLFCEGPGSKKILKQMARNES